MKTNTFPISGVKTLNTGCVAIEGNNNIANAGIIFGDITLNSSLDMRIVQMMLDTLNRNNELLQQLIRLHPTIDKEIVTSSK